MSCSSLWALNERGYGLMSEQRTHSCQIWFCSNMHHVALYVFCDWRVVSLQLSPQPALCSASGKKQQRYRCKYLTEQQHCMKMWQFHKTHCSKGNRWYNTQYCAQLFRHRCWQRSMVKHPAVLVFVVLGVFFAESVSKLETRTTIRSFIMQNNQIA